MTTQLITDMIRFFPYQKIGNLVTVLTIYVSAAIYYFQKESPALLFILVLALSLFIWLIGYFYLQFLCRKLDVEPLKAAWKRFKEHDEIIQEISRQFKRMEDILLGLNPLTKSSENIPGKCNDCTDK